MPTNEVAKLHNSCRLISPLYHCEIYNGWTWTISSTMIVFLVKERTIKIDNTVLSRINRTEWGGKK
jgi:hypothetical protein